MSASKDVLPTTLFFIAKAEWSLRAVADDFIYWENIGISEKQCMTQLEKEFGNRKYVKRLLVIKRDGELIEFPQK